MSSADTADAQDTPVQQGPGKQLKAIREAQGLELTRVAASLHLSVPLLEALERDDYAAMAGPVFVQGYLRNYARLMGVDAEAILESYGQVKPESERLPDLRAAQVKHEVRSSHGLIRAITWLIIIGLIALLAVWWRGYLQWPLQMDPIAEVSEEAMIQSADAGSTLEEENDPPLPVFNTPPEMLGADAPESPAGETQIDITPPVNETDVVEENLSDEVAPQEPVGEAISEASEEDAAAVISQPASVLDDTAVASTVMEAETTAAALEPVQVVEEANEAAAEQGAVVISFSGPCWVEISGANQSYRWFGNQKAGGELTLEGEAPYSILLGNAAVVSMQVNGEAYDLAPHTRGNVARFSLELN